MDSIETLRAADQLGRGLNEARRQGIGRAAFAAAFGIPCLAALVECSICGLLDDADPCGDHDGEVGCE